MEQVHGNAEVRALATHRFGEHPVLMVEWRGQPAWSAREIGRALGYADDREIPSKLRTEWSDRLREGDHVLKLEGADLAALKRAHPDAIDPRTPSLLLLTERGLYRVLMLSGKPQALAFQDWLDGEVLPSLRRTGSYSVRPGRAPRVGAYAAEGVAPEPRWALQSTVAQRNEVADWLIEHKVPAADACRHFGIPYATRVVQGWRQRRCAELGLEVATAHPPRPQKRRELPAKARVLPAATRRARKLDGPLALEVLAAFMERPGVSPEEVMTVAGALAEVTHGA